MGRDIHSEPDYSDETAREIDAEIRRIIEDAHQRARDILVEHRDVLESISQVLLNRETIEREEFTALLAGASEEDVFRAKDAAARRERALEQSTPPASESPMRMPFPPPAPGQPIPES